MFNLEEGTALSVVRETDAGIIVRGARVLATLDDVQLVLTRSSDGLEVVLAPGERLALRRNAKRVAT